MNQAQQEAQSIPLAQASETIPVDDLDTFVKVLTAWHTEQCAIVQHLLEVPEGTVFEIGDESLVLDGEALNGFKFGIEMVMMQLGELPFVAEFEAEQEEAATSAAG